LDYAERGQKMPLTVVIGGDPSFLLAAASPISARVDLAAVAGMLRGKPLDVVMGRNGEILVPAEAEIVLEGFIDPAMPPIMTDGVFYGPLGQRVPPRSARVFQVTAMTHRANPLFAANFFSRPPHELCTMTRAMHRAFRPLLRAAMPDLVDFHLPEFAAGRHWAAVSIRKTYAGQVQRAAHAAWSQPAMRFAKTLIVVDADVDVRNTEAVLAAACIHADATRDTIFSDTEADPYDSAVLHSSDGLTNGLTRRVAIDATRK
jgi:4-hydroxy-3-polyprenylbenzoate decarboxylase